MELASRAYTFVLQFSYTKRPSTVIRNATLDVASLLDASKKVASRDARRVIGEHGPEWWPHSNG